MANYVTAANEPSQHPSNLKNKGDIYQRLEYAVMIPLKHSSELGGAPHHLAHPEISPMGRCKPRCATRQSMLAMLGLAMQL
jgi:hypothetical protein